MIQADKFRRIFQGLLMQRIYLIEIHRHIQYNCNHLHLCINYTLNYISHKCSQSLRDLMDKQKHIFQGPSLQNFYLISTHLHIQCNCNLSYPCMFYMHYCIENNYHFFHNNFHLVQYNQQCKSQQGHHLLFWHLNHCTVSNFKIHHQLLGISRNQNIFFIKSSISFSLQFE